MRVVAALALLFSLLSPANASAGPVVPTTSGPVRGVDDGGFRAYQGIPYAAPPVGSLRWTAPRPVRPWSQVRDATKPGPACRQDVPSGTPESLVSEDCLYLNVTAPKSAHRLPVMVWLHGGGFFEGQGSDYDPRRLIRGGNVVVVTVNYRLGIFGFFNHPSLGRDGGAFGLQDQQAALRWVRANVARFGGDASNVTLFGESAGGMSTCSQLVSPAAAGLFDKAIVMSGSCSMNWPKEALGPGLPAIAPWIPASMSQGIGAGDMQKLGCDDLKCLRGKKAAELMKYFMDFALVTYGNRTLPEAPAAAVEAGHFHRIPVMQGNTRDEHSSWVAYTDMRQKIDLGRYRSMLAASFGRNAAKVEREYPASGYATPATALSAVWTDRSWICPALVADKGFARHTRTYAYEFGDRTAPPIAEFPADMPPGASHGSDLVYLFDVDGTTSSVLNAAQRKLSGQMIGYVTSFAATGRPGWRAFPTVQSFVPGAVGPVDLTAEHHCGFWSAIS
ncbi:carboxylesterase/lipase family protein [Fodinicola acaciae]|uniref:carboxylesterase/lipase family protein n=1 Tax=Fodinicola acaciae TaxID=2681555 RepID=UPI001C9E706B|nr:carboxylesterase family protein [Fodinicola acaciae]